MEKVSSFETMVTIYCYCFRQHGSSRAVTRKIVPQHEIAATSVASSSRSVNSLIGAISAVNGGEYVI
jgi:hypothetical protein